MTVCMESVSYTHLDVYKRQEVDYADIRPMALAMSKKEKYDYRMPVWYTYGTREPSYPVFRGSTQQHQYDFWKQYNRCV